MASNLALRWKRRAFGRAGAPLRILLPILATVLASPVHTKDLYVLRTTPPVANATILVDDSPPVLRTDDGGKAILRGVEPGLHWLTIENEETDYGRHQVAFDPELNVVELQWTHYTIDCDVEGASIALNGREVAQTLGDSPTQIPLVVGSTYELRLSKEGYVTQGAEIVAKAGKGRLECGLESVEARETARRAEHARSHGVSRTEELVITAVGWGVVLLILLMILAVALRLLQFIFESSDFLRKRWRSLMSRRERRSSKE